MSRPKTSDTPRLTPEQALTLIESLAALGELDYASKDTELGRRFGRIYSIAHSTVGVCPHPDWEREAVESYDEMAAAGEFDPRPSPSTKTT